MTRVIDITRETVEIMTVAPMEMYMRAKADSVQPIWYQLEHEPSGWKQVTIADARTLEEAYARHQAKG